MTVEFKFSNGQKVINRFGQPGYISSVSKPENGDLLYYVQYPDCRGQWENEKHLTAAEEEKTTE